MNAWLRFGGGHELLNDFCKKLQLHRLRGGQHRRADGRLVPQGDQVARRHEGPQVPDRRLCRHDRRQARRRAAAAGRRRHLSGAGEGHARRVPNGSAPTTTRSSASRRSRKFYYYPGWWEGCAKAAQHHQPRQVERAAEALPGGRRAGLRTTPRTWMLGEIRPRQSGRAEAPGRRRRAAARRTRRTIMEACYKAANEIYAELVADQSRTSRSCYDSVMAFRSDSYQWMQVAELGLRQLHDAHAHART